MASPVWSRPTDSGAYEFGFDDGTTTLLPPTPAVKEKDAALPNGPDTSALAGAVEGSDPMAGATAQNDASNPEGLYYDDPTIFDAPPVASRPTEPKRETDAEAYARLNGASDGSSAPSGAGGMSGNSPPASGASSGAGGMNGSHPPASPYGAAAPFFEPQNPLGVVLPPSAPSNYARNPNEGGGASAPRPAGPSYHTIKGGPRTAQWGYQYRNVPEEARESMMAAQDDAAMANQMGALEGHADWERQNKAHEDANITLAQMDAENSQKEAKRLQEQRYRREQLDREVSELETDVNPNNYWENKSTLSKILLSVAIGAGALGGAMTGQGGNQALGIVNDQIGRDIDAQKEAIKNKKAKLDRKESLYARMLDHYGDERRAELATRAAMMGRIEREMGLLANEAKDPTRASQITRMQAEAKMARGQMINELDGRNVSETVVNVPDRTIAVGGTPAQKPDKAGAKAYAADRAKYTLDEFDPLYREGITRMRRYGKGQDVPGLRASDRWIVDNVPGGIAALRAKAGDEAADNYQWSIAMGNKVLRAESGAVISPDEARKKAVELFGDGTSEQVQNGMRRADTVRRSREDNLARGHGPAAVQTYWGNPSARDNTPPDVGFRGAGNE